jgi:EAL domain-containing protein (putative c-di-GMP-specific phosphodiesterase class I)/DNA-binding NarL/FixJ family response regulator
MTASPLIRVLIAEDDAAVRGALSDIIRTETTLELAAAVADGDQAIEAAAREQPHVALLDVRMPGGGAVAVRGIKRVSPETSVLALSAHDDRVTVLEMLEAGVSGYLVKGSSIGAIVDSIERAAAGQGSLSGKVAGDVIEVLAGQLTVRRRADERRERREVRIRRAIEDDTVLRIVFQPICTLGGDPVGVEALSRFDVPPKRGPERWFAEASEVGLRRELELAAVRKALQQLPLVPADMFLSVNVSPGTLMAAPFRKLLEAVDGTRIVVEVTEHAPIEDYERLGAAVGRLRDCGVRLAVDDAGAGFASLRHILRLAPDFIKLDRTLIAGIEVDRSRQALAAGLISFARKIDATIVAEGIERPAEVAALQALGVAYGQGFFLARPGPLPLSARRDASGAGAGGGRAGNGTLRASSPPTRRKGRSAASS